MLSNKPTTDLKALVEASKQVIAEKDLDKKPKKVKETLIPDEKKKGFIENPKALRNARSGALGLIIILIPLFYFLISETFSFSGLLTWSFGGIMVVTTLATTLTVMETRKRAFEDAIILNPDIAADEVFVTENGLEISEKTLAAIPILNEYNRKMQKVYDLKKTQKKIDKLQRRNASIQITMNYTKFHIGKVVVFNSILFRKFRVSRIKRIIERLNKFPKRDRKFKPYRLEKLLSCKNSKHYTSIGDKEISSNPQAVDVKKSVIKLPLKGFMMSLTGGVIPLAFGADFWTILAFYGGYLSGMVFTILSQYILTKYKTNTEYRLSLDKKKKLQIMILTELKKPVEVVDVVEVKKEDEVEVKKEIETNLIPKGQLCLDLFNKGVELSVRG